MACYAPSRDCNRRHVLCHAVAYRPTSGDCACCSMPFVCISFLCKSARVLVADRATEGVLPRSVRMSLHLGKAAWGVTWRRAGQGRHWSQEGQWEAIGVSEGVDAVCHGDTEGKRGRRQGGCPAF